LGDSEEHFEVMLNTGTLNPVSCLRHFCMFTKENKGVLLKEVEVLGLRSYSCME